MPDWSYRTVLRPLLFALPTDMARALALESMGRLARTSVGRAIIDGLGHMRPDPHLTCRVGELEFPGPIGIGAGLDPAGIAAGALAQFGVGFLEVGPVSTEPTRTPSYQRLPDISGWAETGESTVHVDELIARLQPVGRRSKRFPAGVKVFCRLPHDRTDLSGAMTSLLDWVDVFVVPVPLREMRSPQWPEQIQALRDSLASSITPAEMWGRVALDSFSNGSEGLDALRTTLRLFDGIVVDVSTSTTNGVRRLPIDIGNIQSFLIRFREVIGEECPVLISGGITQPVDVLAVLKPLNSSGANLVAVDTGLVFSGPGLVKRANEALVSRLTRGTTANVKPAPQQSWFWLFLMGFSLLAGGGLAIAIAATRVILPYDEAFVGMTRVEFIAVSPRLLPFLTHDRFTLAGTMLSLGWLYLGLSTQAVRVGKHWAQLTMQASAFAGFFSFFLFLGFGYFDPFHAFVTVILLQFLLLSMLATLERAEQVPAQDLFEDVVWRRAQWGQLLYVVHGAILLVAGLVIATIGATSVFVPEDLEFMQLCAADLTAANPRLIPLIAHDRATFGGMLIATGVCVLLFAMWGLRRGEAWQWWCLTIAGGIGYSAAIGIHLVVGYISLYHLAPAIGGGLLAALGSALLFPFLCARSPKDIREPVKLYRL